MQDVTINPGINENERETALRPTVIKGAAIKLEPLRTITTPLPTKPNTADPEVKGSYHEEILEFS